MARKRKTIFAMPAQHRLGRHEHQGGGKVATPDTERRQGDFLPAQ